MIAGSAGVGLLGGAASMPAREAAAQNVPQTTPPSAGLDARSENGATQSLPIVSEKLTVRIDGGHAQSTYEHVFQNASSMRLEGNYHLLVGEGATATGFAYWNGEDKIVGEVFERESAQKVYEALTGLKKDPGLLEQTGEGAFSFRVFPIEPNEQKRVQVSTSHWLERHGDAIEFRARVASANAQVTFDVNDARGVDTITSTTHDIDVVRVSPTEERVTVKKAKDAHPVELSLDYTTNAAPVALSTMVHHDAGHDVYFTASLATPPAAQTTHTPNDITIVIDRSGSMSGDSIANARAAAIAILDKLASDDAVNVIAFDDKVEHLYDAPRVVTDDVKRDVKRYVATIDARGGTDIALALKEAFKVQKHDDHPDAILFLTDGESDGPSAIAAAQNDSSSARVFTVGIGSGVDKALLARLAQIRHGRFTFIPDIHAVASEFPRVLSQLQAPVLTDITIKAEGATIQKMYPSTFSDLFPADEVRVFGRMTGTGPAKIVIEGKDHGVAKTFESPIDVTAVASAPFVARSWARARVDELMGDMREKGETDAVKNEIIDLGLAYELVTQYTSFLAVPEKELTKAASDAVSDMRQQRAKVLAANKDAAALSRMNMPPGDPVLRVNAPRDARRVTAMFPFGLTQDLAWDDLGEGWSTRFLVPKDVADGEYDVPVVIVSRDGTVTATSVHYTIDSKAPSIDVVAKGTAGGADIRVTLDEAALEVRAADADDPQKRTVLTANANANGEYVGTLRLDHGHHRVRVVVADAARNESERVIDVEVP